jgi:hypothetical protein
MFLEFLLLQDTIPGAKERDGRAAYGVDLTECKL